MLEVVLHYIWQRRYFVGFNQRTTDGRKIEIISVGEHNLDAGPDFFNAHIRIEDTKLGMVDWIGNVEIHIHSSDWYEHRHHLDKAYDNVILHVVNKADKEVYNTTGRQIVQCELQYPKNIDYLSLIFCDKSMQCYKELKANPLLLSRDWKTILLHDRLKRKEEAIYELLHHTQNDWETAFYITLAHNFGFHTNGIPFEMLAKQTPLKYLNKHRSNLFQLQALLLGQSGLLRPDASEEDARLQKEYLFLQSLYELEPLQAHLWKKAKMRPQSFPETRIRQFAALLYQKEFLFSKIMDTLNMDALIDAFTLRDTDQQIGKSSIELLLINSVIPYQYAYAHEYANSSKALEAMKLMDDIPAENNHIIRLWKQLGQRVSTASDSQALIHLYQNYCTIHRCTQCDIGYHIFAIREEDKK